MGMTKYNILSTNTDKIWQGTVVIGNNAGYIVRGSATGSAQNPVGVFSGCNYVSSTSKKPVWSNYWPGADADPNHPIIAHVYDNPMQSFLVSANALFASAAALQAAVFGNVNLVDNDSGTDSTGMSSGKLDVSSLATTANHLFRVVGVSGDMANEDTTAAGIGLIVRFNRHFNLPVGTTTGLHA